MCYFLKVLAEQLPAQHCLALLAQYTDLLLSYLLSEDHEGLTNLLIGAPYSDIVAVSVPQASQKG